MKTLYLECRMGAAGDMLMAALSELTDQNAFIAAINNAGIPGVTVSCEDAVKCGIKGTHMNVRINGDTEEDHTGEIHHHGMHLHEIHELINELHVSEKVRKDAAAVYDLIAEAESHVHGEKVEEIHFHEVGMMDAVADIVGVCILMEMIGAERVVASPVAVGNGMVKCAHGLLPVPAPAAAYLLQGIPSFASDFDGELCTPTGAALLKYFVNSFENMPTMVTEKTGYGMGTKDFPAANCLRAFLGDTRTDGEVIELVCNLDDLTPEETGYAFDALFAAGALDVYITPVHMKKNRPGIVFTCMCRANDRDRMIELIFRHTTTLGIRENVCRRHALSRSMYKLENELGTVRVKRSEGYGVVREKMEFEDLAEISRNTGMSIEEVRSYFRKNR